MPGLFITFEGGEGSGKTTQLRPLLAYLRSAGKDVVETRDPGGTSIGKQIRALLLDRDNTRMAPATELLLYEASRAQLVQEIIRPALAAGRVVLCDRFTDSTVAYQGYGRGLDLHSIARLNALATDGLRPDLTFLLDLDPAVGLLRATQRVAERQAQRDRIEGEVLAFHQRVRTGYRTIAAAEPQRVIVLDASGGMAEIEARIRRRVDEALRAILGAADSGIYVSG
jgi:dTMP kinase